MGVCFSSLVKAFIFFAPFIEIFASTLAPDSTASFPATTSPSTLAEDFSDNIPETSKLPFINPAISEFEHVIFPKTTPFSPTTTLPVVVIVPSTFPSILKSALEVMSPTTFVVFSIISIEFQSLDCCMSLLLVKLKAINYFINKSKVLYISIFLYWEDKTTKLLLSFNNSIFFSKKSLDLFAFSKFKKSPITKKLVV